MWQFCLGAIIGSLAGVFSLALVKGRKDWERKMGICGNCHYNYEYSFLKEEDLENEACGGECTFEDAIYREQWAYDQLAERMEDVQIKHAALVEHCLKMGYAIPEQFVPGYNATLEAQIEDGEKILDAMAAERDNSACQECFFYDDRRGICRNMLTPHHLQEVDKSFTCEDFLECDYI